MNARYERRSLRLRAHSMNAQSQALDPPGRGECGVAEVGLGSAVRVVLRNPLYTGHVRRNVSQFVRHPDTGAYKRRKRTEAEWVHHHDESLRIVPDELFEKVHARLQRSARGNGPRTGRNVKFLLSGFVVCDSCGANYVMVDAYKYACSSYTNGRAC
jgi:site-specific DNA recombinase